MQNDLPMSNWNIFQAVHIVICIICKWLNIVWTQFNVCNKCVWWINTQAVNLNRWMESIFQFLHWIRDFHFFFLNFYAPVIHLSALDTYIYVRNNRNVNKILEKLVVKSMHSKDIYKVDVVLQPKSFPHNIHLYSMMLLHVGFSAMALLVFAHWRQVSIERCTLYENGMVIIWMDLISTCANGASQEKCQEHWKMPAMSRNSLLFADSTFVEISHTSISRLNSNEFVASSGFLSFFHSFSLHFHTNCEWLNFG